VLLFHVQSSIELLYAINHSFIHKAPQPSWPKIDVFSNRLNCPKVMSGCRSR